MFDPTTRAMLPSDRALRVHLLRHAETIQGQRRVCRGQSDVPLSARGLDQSRRLAAACLRRYGAPPHLHTSDLSRCADLAALLSPDPVPAADLREQHMGAWEGRAWEDLSREDPDAVRAFWADYVETAPPGGESVRDLSARLLRWWGVTSARVPAAPTGEPATLTVVTHAGPIRALLCAWLGLPPSESLRFAPPPASLTEVLLSDSGCVLTLLGWSPDTESP